MGIGFVDNIKVRENKPIEENDALNKWFEILGELCEEVSQNFRSIDNITDKEETREIVKKGNEMHKEIGSLIDYIRGVTSLNGIDIKEYIKRYKQHPYIEKIFCPENGELGKSR